MFPCSPWYFVVVHQFKLAMFPKTPGRDSILLGSLTHVRFWDEDGNRKWAVFPFNLSSHNHIYIAKHLFTIRDPKLKNLVETAILECKMFTPGCRPRLKNARA